MASSLPEIAEQNVEVTRILRDLNKGNVAAAEEITELGYRTTETSVRRFRRSDIRVTDAIGDVEVEFFTAEDREALHNRLDDVLDRARTKPQTVKGLKVGSWDTVTKDNDGNAEQTRNYKVELQTEAVVDPLWPVVQPAQPVTVKFPKALTLVPSRKHKTALILPDTQIGYRLYADDDMSFDPFHDGQAIDVAFQIMADLQPDLNIWLGDVLDLPTFGRYEQEITFAATTQKSIDYAHAMFAKAAFVPKQVMLEGNHDRRIQKMVTANAMAAFGLRRANEPNGWPVLSVPHLCRLDDVGIQYVGGYPAGQYYINERLKCIHGEKVRSSGSTAKAVVDDERTSVVFGHIHRIETHYKTSNVYDGGRVRLAHSPGCLCRIDGAVPSVHGSTNLDGRPVEKYENWQQGLSVVSYFEGDGSFSLDSVFINTFDGYRASFGGKVYQPAVD